MADTLVTDETPKTSLTGTEEIYINDSGADKKASISNVRGGASQTELGYLVGVSSLIQTQLDGKFTSSKIIRVFKSSDETISSDNTLSNDSELSFSVEANKKYIVMYGINLTSGATPDFKHAFSVPSGTVGYRFTAFSGTPTTSSDITTASASSTTGTRSSFVLMATLTTSSTPGTVYFQWAQNTSDASNTTVHGGSFLVVMEVD